MTLYKLIILGDPEPGALLKVKSFIEEALSHYGLKLGLEVDWCEASSAKVEFKERIPTAAIFFGSARAIFKNAEEYLNANVPILPVVSDLGNVSTEIPDSIRNLNCLSLSHHGAKNIAMSLLECVGLLPRQRRVFVSYRRSEAKGAAVQLFNELSARQFDVFLDTHGVPPAQDFQATLWNRLCESEVLIMLDTETYFDSRWTEEEFGRAMAKNLSILRIGWPGVSASKRIGTAKRIDLVGDDLHPTNQTLNDGVIDRICCELESLRSISFATRHLHLVSNLRQAIESIGGQLTGMGMQKKVGLCLASGIQITVHPVVGIPTSQTAQEAMEMAPGCSVAVVYDQVGVHHQWVSHLDWLGAQIPNVRWVKVSEAAWTLAGWGV